MTATTEHTMMPEHASASSDGTPFEGKKPSFERSTPIWRFSALLRAAWLLVAMLGLTLTAQADPVQVVDLSGTWGFRPDGGALTTIEVPGGGWYKQGYTDITTGDYETNITIPDSGQPQVTVLEFGVVNYQADLYIDGEFIETRVQGWTPCAFDISDHVVPGNSYDIRVHVKGRKYFFVNGASLVPHSSGWAPWTAQGIFRSAELKVYPEVYISDVFVRPSVANDEFYYEVSIHNGSDSPANIDITGDLTSWNGDAWSYPTLPVQPVSIPANSTTTVTVNPISWGLGSASYWWPNVPYVQDYQAKLHNLNLDIVPSGGGAILDEKTTRFGFRESNQGPDGLGNTCYFLNGTRVNYRGDSIQVCNYDSIFYDGGQSDAVDTLPGFLPPSEGNPGWPKAVDNYQRLNFNVVRIHQQPLTPYMMDVCDEMGLMLIHEPAFRGSDGDQNWVDGRENFTNHLRDLLTRDRNHPSVVRVSQNNESNFSWADSIDFEAELFEICMEVGHESWPVSIDCGNTPPASYDTVPVAYNQAHGKNDLANFATYAHYGGVGALGQYTDAVFERSDMPYGQGEFLWFKDNTVQGFTWFGTSVQAMRSKGASDARPYTLLSAWISLVPGVNTTDVYLENATSWYGQSPYSVYGEDNLPDPWSNPQFQRVQAGFNPVLVADKAYWELQKVSNSNGDWPANTAVIGSNQNVTRTLTIYNDTFSGTAVDVFWELRQDSATGTIADSGVANATVPLGYTVTQDITFTTPDVPDGTALYLVLYTEKGGVELFRENSQKFLVFSQSQLSGSAYGATPPYSPQTGYDKAFDGDINTFFDFSNANGGYVGIDLGAGNETRVSSIEFSPRAGLEWRMEGGVFRGSVDGVNFDTIYTVNSSPSPNTTVLVNSHKAYRYLEYVGPDGGYCNIAELAFYSNGNAPLSGSAFGASPSWAPGYEYDKATDGDIYTFYDYVNPDGGFTGIDLGAGNEQTVNYIVYTARSGFEWRLDGGEFFGSNDGQNYYLLETASTPADGNNVTVFVNDPTAYRYLVYSAPDGSYGNIAEVSFYADAGAPPQNGAPTFNADPITETGANEGVAFSSTLSDDATDPDSDPLTFSKIGGPAWLSIASNGSLSGTPGAGDVGLNSWTVQVDDGQGGSDTVTLEITVAPAAASTDVYVADIAMGSISHNGGRYSGTATITVKDEFGAVVPNATVYVDWSGAVGGSDSGTTDGSGVVFFESSKKKNGGTFTATVNNVTASGSTYNSGLNVETSDSITAP